MTRTVKMSDSDIGRIVAESERRRSHTKSSGAMDHTSNGSKSASEMGVVGEWCVSIVTGYKPLGFRYDGKGKERDVVPIEVGSTERSVLYFKDFENPNDPIVAVKIIDRHTAKVIGWRFGFECMKEEYQRFPKSLENMRPGQKCWWEVPHESLYSLQSLENWCVSHGYKRWPKQSS